MLACDGQQQQRQGSWRVPTKLRVAGEDAVTKPAEVTMMTMMMTMIIVIMITMKMCHTVHMMY